MKNTFYEIHGEFLFLALFLVFIFFVLIVVIIFIAAIFVRLLAATLLVGLTAFVAAVPDRVGNHIQMSHRMVRIVTVDHKLTRPGYLLRCLVLNHDI